MASNCPLRTSDRLQLPCAGQEHSGRITAQIILCRSFSTRHDWTSKYSRAITPTLKFPQPSQACRKQWRPVELSASIGNDNAKPSAVEVAAREPEADRSKSEPPSREAKLESSMAELDELLEAGKEEDALQLLKRLAGKSGPSVSTDSGGRAGVSPLLLGFGNGSLVPKRSYSIPDLRLQKIDTSKLLSPRDSTLAGIRSGAQLLLLSGLAVLTIGEHLQQWQVLTVVAGLLFIGTMDQIGTGGGVEALAVDLLGNALSERYRSRVALHEAGHFLVAYVVGIPPKGYTLSGLDALKRYGALNVQAGTTFLDLEFQKQVKNGTIRSDMLDAVATVALAGILAEYLAFGVAEGGLSDIGQLDALFRAIQFTQKKSDDVVFRAVLDAATLLRRHSDVHNELAKAMAEGQSVGKCVLLIEKKLSLCEVI